MHNFSPILCELLLWLLIPVCIVLASSGMYSLNLSHFLTVSGSISSGDSVLVGVEDNPEFKSAMRHKSEGIENPGFISNTTTIDDLSMPNGGAKTNPLLQLSSGGAGLCFASLHPSSATVSPLQYSSVNET